MEQESLHLPDFIMPDFTQPALEQADLSTPGFTLPDPERSGLVELAHTPFWPTPALERLAVQQPDPASPDLLEPEIPAALTLQDGQAHIMPAPICEPEVEMQHRPGEMDPSARSMLLSSPDREALPPHISYPQLYTTEDEMNTRKRHLGMLELGLEDGR